MTCETFLLLYFLLSMSPHINIIIMLIFSSTFSLLSHQSLLGRGASINAHPGNQHFRSLVDQYKQEFETARRNQKRSLASRIVADINQLDPPGRFLMEASVGGNSNSRSIDVDEGKDNGDNNGGIHPAILAKSWVCVPQEKAIVKTMHRLREKGNVGSVVTASPDDGDDKKDNSSSKIADEDGELHLEKSVLSEGNEAKDTSASPPKVTKAKKSIATFKLRQGMPIGCSVTLRRERMWEELAALRRPYGRLGGHCSC